MFLIQINYVNKNGSTWLFWKLDKATVSKESLQKLLAGFQGKWWKKVEERLTENNIKIIELQSNTAVQDSASQTLNIKFEDNEQYTCRYYMPIHGLEYNENDDVHVMNKVERCCD